MTRRPNVILLGVDALRWDRTSPHGTDRPITPSLERLAESGIVCRNAFSLAPFTQPASVQTFTSSRPLSYGGYDAGAKGRPETLFQRFHQAGYRTAAISTLHWVNRYFGYGDGLDVEYQLFTLNTLVGVAIAITRNSIDGYNKGEIPAAEMLDVVRPVFGDLFRNCDDYCARRIENEAELARDFPDSTLVNAQYDFRRVRKIVARHRAAFDSDPLAYVERHLRTIPRAHEWLGKEWYYCRRPLKLLSEAWLRATNKVVRQFDPSLAVLRQNRFKQYVDAESIANKVIRQLGQQDADRPFFIWAHFMDTHLPYVSGSGRRWWRQTPRYLEAVGHDRAVDPALAFRGERPTGEAGWRDLSALYDAAVHWTDEQIGRVLSAVEASQFADNTIIAVCGDHGEELGEHGNVSHYFLPYEHNVRIPFLFRAPGLAPAEIDGLVTLMDVAPSLAEAAGLDPAREWEGAFVGSDQVAGRDHVLMETFYGGNCLFANRPLYFGLRTPTHKYFWKEFRDPKDWQSKDGHELYDLDADPAEQTNRYAEDHPLVPRLNAIVARRMAEIPEINDQRLTGLFGADVARGVRNPAAAE